MSDADFRRLCRTAAQEPTVENLARLGAAYLRNFGTPPQTLRIVGRRWFSKTGGNTYHTVDAYLDDELLGTSDQTYGYGDQYVQTGVALALENSDLLPPDDQEAIWRWAERIGITLEYQVTDVRRRRDL